MSINQDRILLLTSSPKDMEPLKFDGHIQLIQKILLEKTDMFDIRSLPARQSDLLEVLETYKPNYIHFAGHGCDEGIYLEDEDRNGVLLRNETLKKTLGLLGTVRCILLISCYTDGISKEIVEQVDFVIGMTKEIYPTTGDKFSESFYSALVKGMSIEESFNRGLANLGVHNLHEDIPLMRYKNNKRYQLTISEKSLLTFRNYKDSSLTFQEYLRNAIANGIKSVEIHPNNVHVSNISFDKSTLTVTLPLSRLKKEDLSEDFTHVELLETQYSGMLMHYAKKIDKLKEVHQSFHTQLAILDPMKVPVDEIFKTSFKGKSNSDLEAYHFSTLRSHLGTYQLEMDTLSKYAKGELSFEDAPLIVDTDEYPISGPEWAVDVLRKNKRVQSLFLEVFHPIKHKRDFYTYNRFKDEFDNLFTACYKWLGWADEQIRANVKKLMLEI